MLDVIVPTRIIQRVSACAWVTADVARADNDREILIAAGKYDDDEDKRLLSRSSFTAFFSAYRHALGGSAEYTLAPAEKMEI